MLQVCDEEMHEQKVPDLSEFLINTEQEQPHVGDARYSWVTAYRLGKNSLVEFVHHVLDCI